jgi:hypothetical protein
MGTSRTVVAALAAIGSAACTGRHLPDMENNWHLVAPAGARVAPPAKAHCVIPDCAPVPPPCVEVDSWGDAFFDAYVPQVLVAETRTFLGVVGMPATPFLLTPGEAETPRRGRIALNSTRVSDERAMTDENGTRFELDGEIWIGNLEWVSPRFSIPLGCEALAAHVGVVVTAYSLQYGVLDELRDWVENDLIGSDSIVDAAHTPIGREFSATLATGGPKIDLLDSSPMWKVKGLLKLPLSEGNGCGGGLRAAVSLGVTAPAFGTESESGNSTPAVDGVLALALPLSDCFRLTGAGSLTLPGDSDRLEDLDIDHRDFVWGAYVNAEWWVSHRFAVALGLSANGPYTDDSGLPTDLESVYVNLGLLYRPSCNTEIHLLFSENPGGDINTDQAPDDDLDWNTQRDSDFQLTLGASVAF